MYVFSIYTSGKLRQDLRMCRPVNSPKIDSCSRESNSGPNNCEADTLPQEHGRHHTPIIEGTVENAGSHILVYPFQGKEIMLITRMFFFFSYARFLAPLAVGQRAYVMVRCPSCVRLSVHALTFSLNIFFAETTYRILMKFHRNVPTMVLFRIS